MLSHQKRAVSGVQVSQESRPGFLAVGVSRVMLFLHAAHLVGEIGVVVLSNPEMVPGGGRSLGENYGEGILRDAVG